MVFMLGNLMLGGGTGMDRPVPEVVKQTHAKYWWAYIVLIMLSLVVDLCADDLLGVLFAGLRAFIVWNMVRNSCQNMSQRWLFICGVVCMIDAVLETITLATEIGGRSTSSTTSSTSKDEDGNTVVYYTTVVTETPFFDWSQGLAYNAASIGYILSPAVMIVGSVLCYFAYSAYDSSLWGADPEDGGVEDLDDGRGGLGRRSPREDSPPRSARRQRPLFEGQGQRLDV